MAERRTRDCHGAPVHVGDEIVVTQSCGDVQEGERALVIHVASDNSINARFDEQRYDIYFPSGGYFELIPVVTDMEIAEAIESITEAHHHVQAR